MGRSVPPRPTSSAVRSAHQHREAAAVKAMKGRSHIAMRSRECRDFATKTLKFRWGTSIHVAVNTLSVDPSLGLLPPRRLGALLRNARIEAGLAPHDVVATLGNRLRPDEIEAHERGELVIDDDDVRILVSRNGLQFEALVPQRSQLVLDREEGIIGIGATRYALPSQTPDGEILIRYLAMVYLLRDVKPGRFFVPRFSDLRLLGEAFGHSPDTVRRDLEQHMTGSKDGIESTSRSVMQRLSAPGLGLLVGITSIGALLLMPTGDRVGHNHSGAGRIGTAIVYERDDHATTTGFDDDPNDPRIIVRT